MDFRLALPQDLAALAAMRGKESGSESHWLERISGYYHGSHHPQQALAPRVIFVAEENGKITGFIAGHLTRRYDCDGELQWIDTVPDRRGQGIATCLWKYLADWFREQEARKICVNCAPDNLAAMNFYQKNGAKALNDFWLVWMNINPY